MLAPGYIITLDPFREAAKSYHGVPVVFFLMTPSSSPIEQLFNDTILVLHLHQYIRTTSCIS
jgi:hypothetical protein